MRRKAATGWRATTALSDEEGLEGWRFSVAVVIGAPSSTREERRTLRSRLVCAACTVFLGGEEVAHRPNELYFSSPFGLERDPT